MFYITTENQRYIQMILHTNLKLIYSKRIVRICMIQAFYISLLVFIHHFKSQYSTSSIFHSTWGNYFIITIFERSPLVSKTITPALRAKSSP